MNIPVSCIGQKITKAQLQSTSDQFTMSMLTNNTIYSIQNEKKNDIVMITYISM